MSIGTEINRLLNYALQQGLLEEADRMRERLKELLQDGKDPVYGNE